MNDINKIKKDLKSLLSPTRYEHSLLVAFEAENLAKKYKIDSNKAYIAGLVHDIAKEFSDVDNEYYINKYNLNKELLDPKNKKIVHGAVGAVYVKEKYGFGDDICNAVKYHTIGNPNMSLLDKIVFVSDKIGRRKINKDIVMEKELANKDIDRALVYILDITRERLEGKGLKLHPDTVQLYNKINKEKKK